jgi:branched-chain amino acid transport system substrate-binding protein
MLLFGRIGMENKNKILITSAIIIIVIIAFETVYLLTGFSILPAQENTKELKIGAILPLTGSSSTWGEQIRNGMEIAKEELKEKNVNINIIYEDSQANSQLGLTAYNKLKNVDNVDAMVGVLSLVSVPLVPLSNEDKMPLIMTITSAKDITKNNDYAFRFFSNEKQYVYPHFAWITKEKYPSIALLVREDDFGKSVADVVKASANDMGIEIVDEEMFAPGASDFKAQLTKIKEKNPKAIVFIGSLPVEVSNALKQIKELDIKVDFVEASAALAQEAARTASSNACEGAYTIAYSFTLGLTGNSFREKYIAKYNKDPSFAAAYGYDITMLLAKASNGKKMSGQQLSNAIKNIKTHDSLNGKVEIQQNGEINPKTYSVRIVNGQLAKV